MKKARVVLPGHPVPAAIAGSVRADAGNAAELIKEMKNTVDGLVANNKKEFTELQSAWTQFQSEVKSATKDVVTQDKLDKMNVAMDTHIKDIKAEGAKIAKIDASIEKVSKELDDMKSKLVAMALNGNGGGKVESEDLKAYRTAFNAFFRKGEDDPAAGGRNNLSQLAIKAALSENSNPDGGYTVLPEMEMAIDEVLKETSPMRMLASVRPVGKTNEYKKLVNQHGTASGWVGETESRPQTVAATLSELKFPIMELYAMPAATQSLLDDSYIDINQWLADEVNLEFAYQEGVAFISGNGVNRPRGILGYTNVADASYSWGNIGYIVSGASGAFVADPNGDKCLIDTYFALKTAYRRNATWVGNRKTMGTIRKLKDSDGQPLIQMSLQRDGMIEQLLGRPFEEMPDMPDIAANSYSLAIADFRRAYTIVDRIGTRVLRDPFSSKPYVLFYTTKRVGGGVSNFEAIKLLKFGTS